MKETQWSDEFGYIQDGKVYLKGFLDYPDRQIGEVKQSPEASIKYFRDKFEIARQKVDELHTLVDTAQNKGSYLMKLLHLRQYLAEFDGLGNYVTLFQQLDILEADLRSTIAVNRVRNLEIKQALLAEAELLKDSTDWKETSEKLKDLKAKWIKTGAVIKENEEEIEGKFHDLVNNFFDRRQAYYDVKMEALRSRIAQYEKLIDQAIAMKDSSDWDVAVQTFKKLQEQWKNVGKIPPKHFKKLQDRFRFLNEYFFNRYKRAKNIPIKPPVRRVDPKRQAQENMATEAERLVQADDFTKAAERAKQLLMEWKNLNMHPKSQDRYLADRFRNACDKIFEMNYLMRVVKRKHFFFDRKSKEDQLSIKIVTMSELIRKDRSELDVYEGNVDGMNVMNKSQTMDKMVLSKLTIQKRKISVKQLLLDEFKAELASLNKVNHSY